MSRPNIILCMTDDQGWGDTGYNGHPLLQTPTLDELAATGIRFDRWYAGAPVCSPTRGSCLTGRHPHRYGIFHANVGHLPKEEVTLAEALKTQGYVTGHFGKWHLGTLTTTEKDANRGGPENAEHYSPPWDNGFDACFSTESKVPTYNPLLVPDPAAAGANGKRVGEPYGTHYWVGPNEKATDNLDGDDSRVIMDRAIPFVQRAAEAGQPFFAVLWFHAPHLPVVAGARHRALYADQPEEAQHYFGCLTAMDEQLGRLRRKLTHLGIRDNTMLWFCSDNGPEGAEATPTNGSAGPFRGRKRSLYEGGVRVPGLLEWPARLPTPRVIDAPCSTLDYFPTVLAALGFTLQGRPEPEDGVNLLPLLEGKRDDRPTPLAFESVDQVSLIDNRYKLYSSDGGKTFELYDLRTDPAEENDLAAAQPERVRQRAEQLAQWRESCRNSLAGKDYATAFTPGPGEVHLGDRRSRGRSGNGGFQPLG